MADSSGIPQATVVPQKRARISIVWIIPILAAVVAVGIAVQRIMSEGPTITIVFKAAEGLEAGKTTIKYKDVSIGTVTKNERFEFMGLDVPPIITGGQPGRQFVLRAQDLGSLGIGSPIYFRRLQAGQVIAYDLSADGN